MPSTASLTALRMVAPLAPVAAVLTMLGGAGAARGAPFLGAALLAAAVAGTGELGEAFAQASAYGDEHRFPLRPAVGYLLAVVVSWCAWASLLVVAVELLAHEVWWAAAVLGAVAVAGAWPLGVRCHRCRAAGSWSCPPGSWCTTRSCSARRCSSSAARLVRVGLALDGTEAADLTGPSGGHAVEIATRDAVTVAFAATRANATGRAIHARAFLVSPTRPGRALAEAAAQGLPVTSAV